MAPSEGLRDRGGILSSDAEGDDGRAIAQHGISDLRLELGDELVGKREVEAEFRGLREDRRDDGRSLITPRRPFVPVRFYSGGRSIDLTELGVTLLYFADRLESRLCSVKGRLLILGAVRNYIAERRP